MLPSLTLDIKKKKRVSNTYVARSFALCENISTKTTLKGFSPGFDGSTPAHRCR